MTGWTQFADGGGKSQQRQPDKGKADGPQADEGVQPSAPPPQSPNERHDALQAAEDQRYRTLCGCAHVTSFARVYVYAKVAICIVALFIIGYKIGTKHAPPSRVVVVRKTERLVQKEIWAMQRDHFAADPYMDDEAVDEAGRMEAEAEGQHADSGEKADAGANATSKGNSSETGGGEDAAVYEFSLVSTESFRLATDWHVSQGFVAPDRRCRRVLHSFAFTTIVYLATLVALWRGINKYERGYFWPHLVCLAAALLFDAAIVLWLVAAASGGWRHFHHGHGMVARTGGALLVGALALLGLAVDAYCLRALCKAMRFAATHTQVERIEHITEKCGGETKAKAQCDTATKTESVEVVDN